MTDKATSTTEPSGSPLERGVRPLVDERGPLGTLRLKLRMLSCDWKTTHGMQEAVLAVLDAPEWVQAAEEANTLRTQLAHWKVFGEHAEGERSRLSAEIMDLRLDAERYRYLRENFASVGLHGIELNWDQPDPCDALDGRLDAFISHAGEPQNDVQAAYGGLTQTAHG